MLGKAKLLFTHLFLDDLLPIEHPGGRVAMVTHDSPHHPVPPSLVEQLQLHRSEERRVG